MSSLLEKIIVLGLVVLAVVTAWSVLSGNNLYIG